MTEAVKKVVGKNRRAALWGAAAGIVVLGAWIGYVIATTPERPVIAKAAPGDVVAYVCHERGLSKLTQIEQEDFLRQWHEHLLQGDNAAALQQHIVSMNDDARKQLVDVIFKHLKRGFLSDARQFSALTDPAERSRFVRSRFTQMQAQSAFIREIATALAKDFTGGASYEEWLLRNTTPEDRELGTPYFEALKAVREQIRKETRSAEASKPASPEAVARP